MQMNYLKFRYFFIIISLIKILSKNSPIIGYFNSGAYTLNTESVEGRQPNAAFADTKCVPYAQNELGSRHSRLIHHHLEGQGVHGGLIS